MGAVPELDGLAVGKEDEGVAAETALYFIGVLLGLAFSGELVAAAASGLDNGEGALVPAQKYVVGETQGVGAVLRKTEHVLFDKIALIDAPARLSKVGVYELLAGLGFGLGHPLCPTPAGGGWVPAIQGSLGSRRAISGATGR
jgi:hypothetical protein